MTATELPLHPTSLPSSVSLRDVSGAIEEEQAGHYCIAGVVDVDDFVVTRVTHGPEWARDVVAQVEAVLAHEREHLAPSASCSHLEPDEWVFVLHGPDEAELLALGIQLAQNVCREVAACTPVTATVSLGGVHDGEYRTERELQLA